MRLRHIIHVTRCFTGRWWFNVWHGLFAVGFGPRHLIERVWIGGRLRYAHYLRLGDFKARLQRVPIWIGAPH